MQNNSRSPRYREGDLVTILTPLDSRVRDKKAEGTLTDGTICGVYGEEVCVLLDGGDIFKGLARDVVPVKEQKGEDSHGE